MPVPRGDMSGLSQHVYDGVEARVVATISSTAAIYIGNHTVPGDPFGGYNPGYFAHPGDFKWDDTTSSLTKYYEVYSEGIRSAGATRIAVRGTYLRYLLSDHLGSTTVSATGVGDYLSELRYKPFGETRFSDGTTPTKRHYQGQVDEDYIMLY